MKVYETKTNRFLFTCFIIWNYSKWKVMFQRKSPLKDFVNKTLVSHQRRFFFFSFDINHFPRQKSQYVWSEIKTEQAKSLVPIYHRHYQFYMHRCMSATTKTSLKVIDQPRNWVLGKILRIRKKSDFHSHEQNSNEIMAD